MTDSGIDQLSAEARDGDGADPPRTFTPPLQDEAVVRPQHHESEGQKPCVSAQQLWFKRSTAHRSVHVTSEDQTQEYPSKGCDRQ